MPVGIFLDLKSPSKIDASSKWIFMKRQKIGSLHSIILNNPGNSPKKRTEISNEPNYQNAPKKKHKRFPNLIKGRVCEIFCRKLSDFLDDNFFKKLFSAKFSKFWRWFHGKFSFWKHFFAINDDECPILLTLYRIFLPVLIIFFYVGILRVGSLPVI